MHSKCYIFFKILYPTILLCLLSILTGIITGSITSFFGQILLFINDIQSTYFPHFLLMLPFIGMIIVWLYQQYGKGSEQGIGLIFDAINGNAKQIPLRLIPLVVVSTWLTHLCGGSAGREGVAVQIGATISHYIGRTFDIFQKIPDAVKILTISGMAAGFSGLFHTPIAATAFALEVIVVGKLEYRALLSAAISAFTAYKISVLLGLETFSFSIPFWSDSPVTIQICILGIAAGLTGGLFTLFLRIEKKQLANYISNPIARVAVCGVLLAFLLFICHQGRYCGLGTNLIYAALNEESIFPTDILWKLLFTTFTLSIGLQGGEVTPLFSIGACLGAILAPFLGLPIPFAAALGYAAVFGSASNTLLTPILIGGEIFGFTNLPSFIIVCTIARLCNGNHSIYGKQVHMPFFIK